MKVASGERGTEVTHRISLNGPGREEYEQGVSVEMSPLFDFSKEPWMLLHVLMNQLVMAHLVMKYTGMEDYEVDCTVLDVGAGYGELYTLLRRARKAKGVSFTYIGVDVDKDKAIIARQLRPEIDYRVLDMRKLTELEDTPVDCVACIGVLEHVPEQDGIKLLQDMAEVLYEDGVMILEFASPESRSHRDNPFHIHEWTNEEVVAVLEPCGMELLDKFYLSSPKKSWEIQDERLDRIPVNLARNVMSVMSNAMGNDGVVICKKKVTK